VLISRVRNTAFADLWGQLEQRCQCRRLLCQSEQSALEFELEHRLSLRSASKSDAAYLLGMWSVQGCKGFRLRCSCKKTPMESRITVIHRYVGMNADSNVKNFARTPQCSGGR